MDKAQEFPFPIYEFRPDKILSGKILRYNNGLWTPDDGEYDIAFMSPDEVQYACVSLPYHLNLMWSWCLGGNWGAHVPEHPKENPWHYMTTDGNKWESPWSGRCLHPNIKVADEASTKLASMKSCANGNGVNFNVLDKTIAAGLLRRVDTKEVVVPPKIFKCCYCGEHDWKQKEIEYEAEWNKWKTG